MNAQLIEFQWFQAVVVLAVMLIEVMTMCYVIKSQVIITTQMPENTQSKLRTYKRAWHAFFALQDVLVFAALSMATGSAFMLLFMLASRSFTHQVILNPMIGNSVYGLPDHFSVDKIWQKVFGDDSTLIPYAKFVLMGLIYLVFGIF